MRSPRTYSISSTGGPSQATHFRRLFSFGRRSLEFELNCRHRSLPACPPARARPRPLTLRPDQTFSTFTPAFTTMVTDRQTDRQRRAENFVPRRAAFSHRHKWRNNLRAGQTPAYPHCNPEYRRCVHSPSMMKFRSAMSAHK